MKSVILREAVKSFASEGRVEVLRCATRPDKDGVYSATVRVTTPKAVLYFKAWADCGAIGFAVDRTEPLGGLPLFETL